MTLDLDITCRICLQKSAVKYIFHRTPNETKIPQCSEMITNCLCLMAKENDSLPSKLCLKCYSKLVTLYKFKLLAIKSYNYLVNHLKGLENASSNFISQSFSNLEEIKNETVEAKSNDIDDVKLLTDIKPTDMKTESEVVFNENVFCDDLPLSLNEETIADNSESGDDLTLGVIKDRFNILSLEVNDSDIKRHHYKKILTKEKQRLKICDLCGKQVVNIKQHIRKHSENRQRISCENCDRTFMTYGARKNHNLVHHMGLLYYCEICKKHYKRGGEHRRIVHSGHTKQHKCVICEKTFLTRSNLELHKSTHSKVKPFQCSECGKTFRLKYCMLHHKRRVHEGEKSYICHYCSKGFFSPHHLRVHLRSHTKEKVYKCDQCPKMFSTMSAKRGHERRHTGVKNYQCQYCDMAFYDNGALRVHTVSHTKEKNYDCKYCDMKFGRSDHRNRHQRTAHEKNLLFTFASKTL